MANEPGLLQALPDASQVADKESVRYALGYIQLRRSDGRVAATNGRQVYVQTGFQFPWPDDRLIRGSSLFGCRDLPQDQPVLVGRSGMVRRSRRSLDFPVLCSRERPIPQVGADIL